MAKAKVTSRQKTFSYTVSY